MQDFNDCIREAIEIIISIRGSAEVRIIDIFDINMSKKDSFAREHIRLNGEPAIFYGEISNKYDCFTDKVVVKIDNEVFKKSTKINKNQLLINLVDFNYKNIGKSLLYLREEPAAVNANVVILTLKDTFKNIINLRYISIFLNYKDTARQYIYNKATGEKVKRLSKTDFENMIIKVPSLEAQNKIVDNFIDLKKKFQDDIIELEKKIKIVEDYSKMYIENVFKL